jgi:hypothetical protein
MPEQEDAEPPRGKRFADRLEAEEIDLERLRDIVSASIIASLKEGAERVAGVMTATPPGSAYSRRRGLRDMTRAQGTTLMCGHSAAGPTGKA